MQAKTTRAFRTISEAGDELDLQPHVLRFWESKFPQIKPIKRGGGRRFYRPEDIEFLRGIKKLLHDEGHPIKDVQKLIRVKGASSVIDLGRSVEKAALEKDITETVLVPERIKKSTPRKSKAKPSIFKRSPEPMPEPVTDNTVVEMPSALDQPVAVTGLRDDDRQALEDALARLLNLKQRWLEFKSKSQSGAAA